MILKDINSNVFELISGGIPALVRCLNTSKLFYGRFLTGNILQNIVTNEIYFIEIGASEHPGYTNVTVSGIGALVIENAIGLNYIKAFGGTSQSGEPTPENPVDIVCNNGTLSWDGTKIVTTGTQEVIVVTDADGNEQTADVEMLLQVGDVKDEQNVTTGKITRRCGVVYYDGTQEITGQYISTTGGLDVGAIVVYVLDTPITETVEAQTIETLGDYTFDKFGSVFDLMLTVNYKKAV